MIKVLYFASLRERLGLADETLDEHPATLAGLLADEMMVTVRHMINSENVNVGESLNALTDAVIVLPSYLDRLQADLTAIAPGPLEPPLAREMALLATVLEPGDELIAPGLRLGDVLVTEAVLEQRELRLAPGELGRGRPETGVGRQAVQTPEEGPLGRADAPAGEERGGQAAAGRVLGAFVDDALADSVREQGVGLAGSARELLLEPLQQPLGPVVPAP